MALEKLLKLHEHDNIAEMLDNEKLNDIGRRVVEGFDRDEATRTEWLEQNKEALKIAKQVFESKNTPWPNAANVKFPLITSAIISFASRTYPEIIRGDKVAEAGFMGPDKDGSKQEIAKRIARHMSYQLLIESPNWEAETDKLLMIYPLIGLVYRKTYWDSLMRRPEFDLCLPDKITVSHHIKSIESARRITHQLEYYRNDIIERIRSGIFLDILDELHVEEDENLERVYNILEQHCYFDLDDDGYEEPYVVTVHHDTQKVLRIRARFDLENVIIKNNKIVKIPANCYFTDYHFIPNPDGGFHSLGYGALLYPINETLNATINQLLDAGTLSNRQAGFISKGLRMRKGPVDVKPGEWVFVDAPNGMDISRNIVPLPVRDPSSVTYQLLTLMITVGKDLASITDILQGQQPAQNAPATTVLALIKQGLKVHNAVMKRLYRALKKEFEKLVRINRVYLDETIYFEVFSEEEAVKREDYQDRKLLVYPVADPNMSSDALRMAHAQMLMQIIDRPEINKFKVMQRYLDVMEVPNPQDILIEPNPDAPPPPEVEKLIVETQLLKMKMADMVMERELEAMRLEKEDKTRQAQAAEGAARVEQMKFKTIENFTKLEQENAHFAIEKAVEDVDVLDDQEQLPPEQQIYYQPVDIDAAMAPFRQNIEPQAGLAPQPPLQQAPEQAGNPPVNPEMIQALETQVGDENSDQQR